MFLEISRKFIKKETLTQVFSCEFHEISKNTFFHRTPLVAASDGCENSFKTSRKHWWCSPNLLTFRPKSAVSRKKKLFRWYCSVNFAQFWQQLFRIHFPNKFNASKK